MMLPVWNQHAWKHVTEIRVETPFENTAARLNSYYPQPAGGICFSIFFFLSASPKQQVSNLL
jgi:hypothetical protein